jgi:ribosome-associated protein
VNIQKIENELTYKTSRSSGPGGQHANKTESRVTLFFNIENSEALTESEKKQLLQKLKSKLSSGAILQLSSEQYRSQHRNKELLKQRFLQLITKLVTPQKKRKKTKISKLAHKKRLDKKKRQAEKKIHRRKPEI